MALSSTVVAGNDVLAAEYNNLREDIIEGQLIYAADAQASDTYVITVDAQYAAYVTGSMFLVKFNTANTGAATLNVNSLGAKNLVDINNTALQNGAIRAGMFGLVQYDGTSFRLLTESKKNRLISPVYTDATVGNTATETDLISTTIPANILSTSNVLHAHLNVDYQDAGSTNALTIRVKYGATTLITGTIEATASSRDADGYIDVYLFATGATNSQEAILQSWVRTLHTGTWTSGEVSSYIYSAGTSAEDSTADKTFAISVQWGSAVATSIFTMANGFVELKAL